MLDRRVWIVYLWITSFVANVRVNKLLSPQCLNNSHWIKKSPRSHFREDVRFKFYLFVLVGKVKHRDCPIFLKNGPTPASFSYIFGLLKQTIQFYDKTMQKMSIQYTALGFKPTTSWTRVVTHNHYTRAPAQDRSILKLFNYWCSINLELYSLLTGHLVHLRLAGWAERVCWL